MCTKSCSWRVWIFFHAYCEGQSIFMEDNTKEINSIVKLEKHKIIVHIFVPFSLSQISWKISISSIVLLSHTLTRRSLPHPPSSRTLIHAHSHTHTHMHTHTPHTYACTHHTHTLVPHTLIHTLMHTHIHTHTLTLTLHTPHTHLTHQGDPNLRKLDFFVDREAFFLYARADDKTKVYVSSITLEKNRSG